VLARGMPLLAICRGAQEANVALGGTLHQAVHEVGPYRRPPRRLRTSRGAVRRRRTRCDVASRRLARVASWRDEASSVNSVHGQGLDRLAPGLRVEATAPDGLVEAFSVDGRAGFNWRCSGTPNGAPPTTRCRCNMFKAFGVALRNYRDRVRGPLPA
jgi:putative glutamine amidotransferase